MSRSRDKHFGTNRKVLPKEVHMHNMKALSLSVQKLMPRLSFFFKCRSKLEVKVIGSNIFVLAERFCNKEYPCMI